MTLFGGAVAGWPIVARAQQSRTPVIGILSLGSPDPNSGVRGRLPRGPSLKPVTCQARNVAIKSRWANISLGYCRSLPADLVDRHVDVIVVTGAASAALAAKAATSTIPIVFAIADDPVALRTCCQPQSAREALSRE